MRYFLLNQNIYMPTARMARLGWVHLKLDALVTRTGPLFDHRQKK